MPADAIAVREATEADRARWDEFVRASAASGYHEWAWRGVIERTFDHRGHYLMATRGDVVEGVLPLILMKSFLFGRFVCSLPFLNYGGVVARTDEAPHDARSREHHYAVTEPCMPLEGIELVSEPRAEYREHQPPVKDAHRQIPDQPAGRRRCACRHVRSFASRRRALQATAAA